MRVGVKDTETSGEPKWKEAISDVLKNRSKRPIRCVTDLVDHMILESKKIYVGTPQEHTFLMFHDALSTWHEPEVQTYIMETYRLRAPLHSPCGFNVCWHFVQRQTPWQQPGERSWPRLVRIR